MWREPARSIYFVSATARVSVVKIHITTARPLSAVLGSGLIVFGALVFLWGVVLWYRHLGDRRPSDDLRRADDTGKERDPLDYGTGWT